MPATLESIYSEMIRSYNTLETESEIVKLLREVKKMYEQNLQTLSPATVDNNSLAFQDLMTQRGVSLEDIQLWVTKEREELKLKIAATEEQIAAELKRMLPSY